MSFAPPIASLPLVVGPGYGQVEWLMHTPAMRSCAAQQVLLSAQGQGQVVQAEGA